MNIRSTKKEVLIFNLNIIITGLTALFFATKFSIYIDKIYNNPELTSLISTITHFTIYLSLNSVLHYLFHRSKYKKATSKLFTDLGKIYGTQIPTFFFYYLTFFSLNDFLLHSGFSPIISNISAWSIGTLGSRIIHTYLAYKAGVFKN